ncbi:hypothetical protein TOPH_02696 [Tolypocladium ophioglossoides CBS 100239]|uniref:SGNH hydrolase-type esterase domain-containing protein n=1 Tax=Tolypocladium ophioglossoides (strain CBS 100239) TaxID=1163406 RepID=A0A0L0NGE1_TOLOC|nr:hypothetical protein TOPH_02696 [Tolypocladium ophioglossoides CBS 100239]
MRASAITIVSCLLGLTPAASPKQVIHSNNVDHGQVARANATPGVLNPSDKLDLAVGKAIKQGTELRILCAGDSITLGTLSDTDGGDGNGYRLQLRDDLSKDRVTFAGTVTTDGTMSDGYFAGWPGKTINYISDEIEPSLKQRPNIILLHAGTNDMSPNSAISTEGNDPYDAVTRLGALIDQMIKACPDAVVLVAMIIDTCDPAQSPATHEFQSLIPDAVQRRLDDGHHVLAANFTSFPTSQLRDCIHPTNQGYRLMGDYWSDFIAQVPRDWIQAPVGPNPDRASGSRTTGVDKNLLMVFTSLAVLSMWR